MPADLGNSSRSRPTLISLTNGALFLAGIINLGAGTWGGITGNVPVTGTCLTAGLVLLLAATIDRFESLKGLGVEAKTRKLDAKIAEADEVLRRLKELTELTGKTLLSMHSKIGRIGSAPSAGELLALASDVRRTMKAIGSDSQAIREALEPSANILCFDLVHGYWNALGKILSDKLGRLRISQAAAMQQQERDGADYARISEEIRLLQNTQALRKEGWRRLTELEYPNQLITMFENIPGLDESEFAGLRTEAASYVDEMRTYLLTTELPNPGRWIDRISTFRGD